ncbi:MAG: hypothetical protein GXY82_07765 [Methanospirillum sp.]|nr:hypothetical protein [Methanospirillum sp.]
MDPDNDVEHRKNGLAFCLELIDGYEADELRDRGHAPVRPRTEEEIWRECNLYRWWACRTWGFPELADRLVDGPSPGP